MSPATLVSQTARRLARHNGLRSTDAEFVAIAATLAAILVITALDWLAPGEIVIGVMLAVPILLTSAMPGPKPVWVATGVAVAGFLLSSFLDRPSAGFSQVWLSNRLFAFAALPASCAIALILQWRRREVERSRDEALSASDLNQLLMSLLAHDLRAPLSLATQAFEYVESSVRNGSALDRGLLSDTRARLDRSLRAINIVLSVAREGVSPGSTDSGSYGFADLRHEIEEEVASFASEAASNGKTLAVDLDGLDGQEHGLDRLVLRQVLAILLDNAIRYADPGEIRIAACIRGGMLMVRVQDGGPGLSNHQQRPGTSDGSGMGLRLCGALTARAGGSLEVERDGADGTVFALLLPVAASRKGRRPAFAAA